MHIEIFAITVYVIFRHNIKIRFLHNKIDLKLKKVLNFIYTRSTFSQFVSHTLEPTSSRPNHQLTSNYNSFCLNYGDKKISLPICRLDIAIFRFWLVCNDLVILF